MTSGATFHLPVVDGLLWMDSWAMPYEGPLTLLWKIVVANCLGPQELCNTLFNRKLLTTDASELHGRSLLVTHWMSASKGKSNQLGDIVRRAGMDAVSARWAPLIASDIRIRYCKSCLAKGYQSVFSQIDGLLKCPIHNTALLDICMTCGALTPRYALTNILMSSPFCCPNCGEPYGGDRAFLSSLQFSARDFAQSNDYGHLHLWLSNLEALDLSWPQIRFWQCSREGEMGDVKRKVETLGVLRHLLPLASNNSHVASPRVGIRIFREPSMTRRTTQQPTDADGDGTEGNHRKAIYMVVRRRIRRMLLRRHRHCLSECSRCLQIEWGNEVLHPIARVCPVVFGYQLWRHHFESNLTLGRLAHPVPADVQLRDEILVWPATWRVDTKAWIVFALMSFAAYVHLAIEWREREEILDGLSRSICTEDLMQLLMDYRVALSPRYMAWSSRITCLRVKNHPSEGVDTVVIAGPYRNLHEILSERTCKVHLPQAPNHFCMTFEALDV